MKRKALFALNFVPEDRAFNFFSKCVAFRTVIAAFCSIMECCRFLRISSRFYYRVQGVKKFIANYRVVKKFKNSIQNMKLTLLYPLMALTQQLFL